MTVNKNRFYPIFFILVFILSQNITMAQSEICSHVADCTNCMPMPMAHESTSPAPIDHDMPQCPEDDDNSCCDFKCCPDKAQSYLPVLFGHTNHTDASSTLCNSNIEYFRNLSPDCFRLQLVKTPPDRSTPIFLLNLTIRC